jgi:putative effector of murein hydrolase
MQSEAETGKRRALFQTVLICIAIELMLFLLFRGIFGTFAKAVFTLVLVIGPASLWFAGPLYRYLVRANQ